MSNILFLLDKLSDNIYIIIIIEKIKYYLQNMLYYFKN